MRFRFLPKGLFRPPNLHDPCLSQPNEFRYGDGNTIHDSGDVNVELGPTGEVCAVWYRCRLLPFTQNVVPDTRVASMLEVPLATLPKIKAIVFDTQERRNA